MAAEAKLIFSGCKLFALWRWHVLFSAAFEPERACTEICNCLLLQMVGSQFEVLCEIGALISAAGSCHRFGNVRPKANVAACRTPEGVFRRSSGTKARGPDLSFENFSPSAPGPCEQTFSKRTGRLCLLELGEFDRRGPGQGMFSPPFESPPRRGLISHRKSDLSGYQQDPGAARVAVDCRCDQHPLQDRQPL